LERSKLLADKPEIRETAALMLKRVMHVGCILAQSTYNNPAVKSPAPTTVTTKLKSRHAPDSSEKPSWPQAKDG
jgi:hypothetical protein